MLCFASNISPRPKLVHKTHLNRLKKKGHFSINKLLFGGIISNKRNYQIRHILVIVFLNYNITID